MKEKRDLLTGVGLIGAFVLWTVMIQCIDVQAVGQNGTRIGFAAFNVWFHQLTGVHMMIYTITDWLGLVPIIICLCFGMLGLVQLIKRRSLLRVDPDILLLGVYYVVVIFCYFIFEMIPVNYRPVAIFGKGKRVNSIDYVGAWYHKAAELMQHTIIHAAFVSTNSITQGEQVAPLWTKLLYEYHIQIEFAYRTFKWNSEAKEKAAVHCVIIGFNCCQSNNPKYIYPSQEARQQASNINPYLIDAPNVLIESRGASICKVPKMTKGNQPSDGGNLILSQEERDEMLKRDESIAPCIRRYVGSKDFINNDQVRYCIWLKGISPSIYRKNPEILRRLDAVRAMRLASSAAPTRALAEKPYLFFSTPQTDSNYLCIPEVSSERRRYIPIGFMDKTVIASNKLLIIPEANLYHFGVLTSNIHMAWTRTVCGRLKSDYQYSGATVYNNFPWPTPTETQRTKIEQTAQAILDARALYTNFSASFVDSCDSLVQQPH